MNKKLLFATMSLAALTACTNDDFESKNVAEEVSPVQFEVINDNEALTRASMDGNAAKTVIKWSAADGDLFTLYHGGALTGGNPLPNTVGGFENATYKATANAGSAATLTTPTMIKTGKAIMVWPVDTTFRFSNTDGGVLKVSIPANQTNIENNIPYVSDLINIYAYGTGYSGTHVNGTNPAEPNSFNTAGKDRKYPVFMRPMASQLIIHADYVGTDDDIATLYKGGSEGLSDAEAIAEIDVKSVELHTAAAGATKFNTKVPLKFGDPTSATYVNAAAEIDVPTQWATVDNNAWEGVTEFDLGGALTQVAALTSTCTTGIESCKFLILPQANINTATAGAGVVDASVVVNTRYGKVTIKAPGAGPLTKVDYDATEYGKAWYRYLDAATAGEAYETKATTATANGYQTTANIAQGMMQVLDVFSAYKYKDGIAKGEPVGAAGNRWVEVRLNHLDMSDLHINYRDGENGDKWLRDAARVWQKLGLESATVYLDGDATTGEFEISQNTIDLINSINALQANIDANRSFTVQPCNTAGEVCNTIVVTGGGAIRDLRFIKANGAHLANVALKAGETWSWTVNTAGNYIITAADEDIKSIINRGTMAFAANATLQISDNGITAGTANKQNALLFQNEGTLNVNSGVLYVQTNVKNYGTVNIAKGAQYRQDGRAFNTSFTNDAKTKPGRFLANPANEVVGKVINKGVFATVNAAGNATIGTIDNYGLIEHKDVDAKTYITTNQTGGNFGSAFNATTNKMGRINLPWSNKEEDNISVSAAANTGFISVTIDDDATLTSTNLNATAVGALVNYVIINSQIEAITYLPATIKYVEVAMTDKTKEIAWNLSYKDANGVIQVGTATYDGLIILTPVNIKLNTEIKVAKATYLGADMYVGGKLMYDKTGTWTSVTDAINPAPGAFWNGYYGNTQSNYTTKYITY